MSRSYKKSSCFKYTESGKPSYEKRKTFANHKVRKAKEIPSGKSGYKKLYSSYDICDERYFDGHTKKNLRATWLKNRGLLDLYGDTFKDALKRWKKFFYHK